MKTPLVPLHVFIKTLGPPPPLQQLNTYVMRLREHGWNVWKIVQRAVRCGAIEDSEIARVVRIHVRLLLLRVGAHMHQIPADAAAAAHSGHSCADLRILSSVVFDAAAPYPVLLVASHVNAFIFRCNASAVRVQGATSDKDSVGRLVWAAQPGSGQGGGMWPAEVLDVACLPRGRSIPREALAALNQTERLLLQQHVEKADPEGKSAERILLEGLTAADAAPKATIETGAAADAGADDGNGEAGKESKSASGAAKRRLFARACHVPKVFAIFFGSNRWAWLLPDSLLDFAEHRECASASLHCSSTTRGADAVIMMMFC